MTRIVSFTVDGLAGRPEPLHFELQPDVNVFFGLNGTGKSSLLKILFSALSGNTDSLRGVPFERATVTFWSEDHNREVVRSIAAPVSSSDEENEDELIFDEAGDIVVRRTLLTQGQWRTKPRDLETTRFRVDYLSTLRFGDPAMPPALRYRGLNEGMTERQLDRMFAHQVTQTWRRFSNRLLSDVRGIQTAGLADILRSVFDPTGGATDPEIDELTAYHRAADFLARQGAKLKATRESFRKQYANDVRLRTIVSEIDQIERAIETAERPRRELQVLIEKFISKNKQIEFTDRDIKIVVASGQRIDLEALSSGEKQLIRMLLAAVTADRSCVLIDEPELSLHIDWQHDLIGAMQTLNEGSQIVMATHSPEVMAELSDDRIFML